MSRLLHSSLSSDWDRQWRKEGQKLAPSNTRFTSRPTTHLSQILTNTTLATHLAKSVKAPPKSTGATIKPRETPTKAQTEKKTPSQRVQNVLKYIIAQNPHGTLAKSQTMTTGKTTRKAQSAPPTPSKKPLPVDKKLVQITATSSQIAKVLSPLKALVMSKSNATQSSVKTKEAEHIKIDKQESQKCTETMESSPNVAQQSQTINTDLNLANTAVDVPFTDKASEPDIELSQKDNQEVSKTEASEIIAVENMSEEKSSDVTEGMDTNEQAKDSTCLVNSSDDSKSTEPLVEKLEDEPPPPQIESECLFTQKDSPLDLETQPESTVDTICTISAAPDTTPTTTSPVHSLKLDRNRKRPAESDPPPPVKKQALSLTLTTEEVTLTQISKADTLNPPSTRSPRESLDFPSLSDEESNTTTLIHNLVQEETPTVDADKLLRSLSTDSYNREESELASELGVDPSLLDLTEFMGIIQPDGIPGTPTTPLSLPLINQSASVEEPEHSSKASHTDLTTPTIGLEIEKQAAIDHSTEKVITDIDVTAMQTESSVSAATVVTQTTLIEGGLSSNESDVVQLTSKDFDILREIGMNDADLLEGIPQELAATIQAIANIEEEDTVPWKH